MFDPTSNFTEAQLQVINLAGVTVPALREFWGKFPDLELDAAIGGLKGEEAQTASGEVTAPVPEEGKTESAPANE